MFAPWSYVQQDLSSHKKGLNRTQTLTFTMPVQSPISWATRSIIEIDIIIYNIRNLSIELWIEMIVQCMIPTAINATYSK